MEPTQGCKKCESHSTFGGGTGTLDELAGSHTRLAIYPTIAICYQRVVIHALLNTRFRGEGSDLPGCLQITKVVLTEVLQQSLDACI